MEHEYRLYVGIDWATQAHQVYVLDRERQPIEERSVEHSGAALAELADRLTHLAEGDCARVAVAIEIPRGPVVETLIERGFHVFALNPKQLDRFRDRHTVAGAKDDRRDAYVLADSLATDRPLFRQLRLDDPLVIQIREWARIDEDLRQETNRLTNRLREQLHRYYPQVLRLCSAANEPWVWSLLELAPTPAKGARLRLVSVKRLLAQERIRRLDAEAILSELRSPALHVAPGAVEAASAHIALLIPRLRLVHGQRQDCQRRLEALLLELGAQEPGVGQQNEHRDVTILRSMPGVGRVVTATMLAEASHALAERDYHATRAHAGIAPVTRQSGQRSVVIMRHGCNGRLRNAVYHWARVCAQRDPYSRAQYAALRARGHTHGRALRSVADRQLRILFAMLQNGTLYDPTRLRRASSAVPEAASA
jgi:transposase